MKTFSLPFILPLIFSINAQAQSVSLESIQPYRQEQTLQNGNTVLQLISLNSNVNSWYLLKIKNPGPQGKTIVVNLQNPGAPEISLRISSQKPTDLELLKDNKVVGICHEFIAEAQSKESKLYPYSPLCEGHIYSRNKANGYQTNTEKAAQLLRQHLGDSGEALINVAKGTLLEGEYLEKASTTTSDSTNKTFESKALHKALLNEKANTQAIENHKLGIKPPPNYSKKMNVGEWYPTEKFENIYVSLIAPGMISPQILKSYPERVSNLGPEESNALVYLVAFDMNFFNLGWSHGTNQPGIGWSDRLSPEQIQAFGGGAGPDGADTFGDLVNPGHVPPKDLRKTVATISGGFQLKHSHFRWGPFASINKSSHFGFIEDGVIMARPNVGLSTVYVKTDGRLVMKTWSEKDKAEIPNIRYLRQNGLPLIDSSVSDQGLPGEYVRNLNYGNWSGSVDGNLITPRGAMCLIENQGEQYLVYAYFSAASPSSMARVFQAYGCKQAIHLDMNSPGQAYLSLTGIINNTPLSQPLTTDMGEVNPSKGIARYLVAPDFRDFFWIVRK